MERRAAARAEGIEEAGPVEAKKAALDVLRKKHAKREAEWCKKRSENVSLTTEIKNNLDKEIQTIVDQKCQEKEVQKKAEKKKIDELKAESDGLKARAKNLEKLIAEEKRKNNAKKGGGKDDNLDF